MHADPNTTSSQTSGMSSNAKRTAMLGITNRRIGMGPYVGVDVVVLVCLEGGLGGNLTKRCILAV